MDQKTANMIAQKLVEANEAIWNAISYASEIVNDKSMKEIINNTDGNQNALKKIAKAYARIYKEDLVDVGLYERNFQDWDNLRSAIEDHLET